MIAKNVYYVLIGLVFTSLIIIGFYKKQNDELLNENLFLKGVYNENSAYYDELIKNKLKETERKMIDSLLGNKKFVTDKVATITNGKINLKNRDNINYKHVSLIITESSKYDYGSDVFLRLVKHESNFNKDAKSPCGASGYCQLMPFVYDEYVKKLKLNKKNKHENNIIIGAYYFNILYSYWDKRLGDKYPQKTVLKYTIASWNAGLGRVIKNKGVPDYPETKKLIDNVLG